MLSGRPVVFTISKQFKFSASHIVDHLPEGHPCGRLHGHNYTVEVRLRAGLLTPEGFVRDFGQLEPLKRFIDDQLDHRHLNDVVPCSTTSECMSAWLLSKCLEWWPETISVRVSETPLTWAEASCA